MNGLTVFAFLVVGYLLACLCYLIRDIVRDGWNYLADLLSNIIRELK